jgi:hypothetical protein
MAEINIGYKKNDFLWTTTGCDSNECNMNREVADKLMEINHIHNGADERYKNSQMLYDRIVIDTANLGIGIGILAVFIYYNYDVIKPKT